MDVSPCKGWMNTPGQGLVQQAKIVRLRIPQSYRILTSKGLPRVSEFKVGCGPGYRLYAIVSGNHIFVTHGAKKPKDKLVADEIDRARGMLSEWQQGTGEPF